MASPTTTNPPSEQELTQYVTDKLAQFVSRDDLILDVCHLMEWQWDQADLFIKAVQERHFRRIAFGQAPWLVAIGLGILVVGLVLAGGTAWGLWDAYRSEMLTNPSVVSRAPRLMYAFFTGITMIIGSLGGLWIFMSQVIRGR